MAARQFDSEYVRQADEGPRRSAKVIRCGACPTMELMVSAKQTSLPNEAVQAKFARMGWHIGRRPADDRCPACLEKEREAKRKKPMADTKLASSIAEPKVTSLGAILGGGTPQTIEPPRTMSRDDGRIIYEKLRDVYEVKSYVVGWSDKRVADDLGVPRAWVENVRSQFFGEAGGNEQADAFLAQIAALRAEAETFAKERQEFVRKVDRLATDMAKLLREADAIKKEMGL